MWYIDMFMNDSDMNERKKNINNIIFFRLQLNKKTTRKDLKKL